MPILHGATPSPFVRKAMAVLAIKKLPYEHVPSMPFSGDEELAKVSPLSKVPALIDGELDGDLHGGNLFVLPDGRTALLDFGIVASLTPQDLYYISENFQALFNRWMRRLPRPLTDRDRAAGYWWELSMRQIEVARTTVFDAPRHARKPHEVHREEQHIH